MNIPERNARGESPPSEWWTQHGGRIPAEWLRAWQNGEGGAKKKRGKFGANIGHRKDLGFSVRSSLEADMARLLLFKGFQRWTEPYPSEPPADGLWFRYEGREFLLTDKKGRASAYKPDFHIWENGTYRLIETKGFLDARAKKHDRLFRAAHPDIPLEMVTRPILDQMKAESLYEARRRGEKVLDVPGWEG